MHTLTAAVLIVIRAYDVYGVSAGNLRTAASIVRDALAAAGVEVRVVHCPLDPADAECTATPGSTDVLVRVMRAPERATGGDTLGDAFVDTSLRSGSLATLYADRIERLAHDLRTDFGTLLGRALAHEVGHLLLGTPAHAPRGLMRATWSAQSLRHHLEADWVFGSDDVDAIRRRVQERLR